MWLLEKIQGVDTGVVSFLHDYNGCVNVAQVTSMGHLRDVNTLKFDLCSTEGKRKKGVGYNELSELDIFGRMSVKDGIETVYCCSLLGYLLSELLEFITIIHRDNPIKVNIADITSVFNIFTLPKDVSDNGAILEFIPHSSESVYVESPFVGEYIAKLLGLLGTRLYGKYVNMIGNRLLIPLHIIEYDYLLRDRFASYRVMDIKAFNSLISRECLKLGF